MYRHAAERIVRWPVTLEIPADDGHIDQVPISLTYKLPTTDDMRELQAFVDAKDHAAANAFATSRIIGWGAEICDAHGNPIPFSPEALASCLQDVYFHRGAAQGLLAAMSGAPAGNS